MSTNTYALTRIQDTVRMECPGVTDGMMRRMLFTIVREFCQRSNTWLMELVIDISADTNDYILNTCLDADVIRLMSLTSPNFRINDPIEYVDCDPPQYLRLMATSPAEKQNVYRMPQQGHLLHAGSKCPILRIIWNPGSNDRWIATIALIPADPTDSKGLPRHVPGWILEKYQNYIENGICGKFQMQPSKPYTNPTLAQYNMRKFHEGVGIARNEIRHLFTYSGQRWQFPQTFATLYKHKAV